MTAELLLLRHAEAWCNVEDVVGGPHGCRGLTPHGVQQATLLAQRLRREYTGRTDALYSSPRLRAAQTAGPVSSALKLPVRLIAGLREQDLGAADGKPRSVLHAQCEGNPVLQPWLEPADGAESWSGYVERVRRTLDQIVEDGGDRRLVIVTHGEAINAIHHILFDLPQDWPGPLPLTIGNASITRWRKGPWDRHRPGLGTRWDLHEHNDTAHLSTF